MGCTVRTADIRRKGDKLIRRGNGSYLYYSGESQGNRGIGLKVRYGIEGRKSSEFQKVVIKIKIDNVISTRVILVYVLTVNKRKEEIEEFYNKLEETKQKFTKYFTIIIRDWNAKIGKGVKIRGVVGP